MPSSTDAVLGPQGRPALPMISSSPFLPLSRGLRQALADARGQARPDKPSLHTEETNDEEELGI